MARFSIMFFITVEYQELYIYVYTQNEPYIFHFRK